MVADIESVNQRFLIFSLFSLCESLRLLCESPRSNFHLYSYFYSIFSIFRGDLRGFDIASGQNLCLMETSQVFAAIY